MPSFEQPIGADARSNGFTAMRLGLALWVLLMHVWPCGGFGSDPITAITTDRLGGGGTVAVWGFFGLSGFLLATSRGRLPSHAFAWRRMLRILPAYWACILVTSVVVGSWYIKAAWNPFDLVGSLPWSGFASNPTDLVNASLWTLPVELACYVVLAFLPRRSLPVVAPILTLFIISLAASGELASAGWLSPVLAFLVGSIVSMWRIPLRAPAALAAVIGAFIAVGSPVGTFLAAAGIAYAFLWLGDSLPLHTTTDLSYGTYIYAFPVTQVLVVVGAARYGPLVLALTAGAATLGLAAASWFLIERPALSLKSIGSRRRHRVNEIGPWIPV